MRTLVIEEHRLLLHRRLCENLFQRKADAEALINLSRSHLGSERICAKLENVVCDADVIALDDLQPNSSSICSVGWVAAIRAGASCFANRDGTSRRITFPIALRGIASTTRIRVGTL